MKRTMRVQKVEYDLGGYEVYIAYFPANLPFIQVQKDIKSKYGEDSNVKDISEVTLSTSLSDKEWLSVAHIKEVN